MDFKPRLHQFHFRLGQIAVEQRTVLNGNGSGKFRVFGMIGMSRSRFLQFQYATYPPLPVSDQEKRAQISFSLRFGAYRRPGENNLALALRFPNRKPD